MHEADGCYTDIPSGLSFLRSAAGNFPEELPTLMECANYVKYTQCCRRGDLRIGDIVDTQSLPLWTVRICCVCLN